MPRGEKNPGAPGRADQGGGGSMVRRAVALLAVLLLVGLYLVTFVLALAGSEKTGQALRFCLGMTIFVPLFAWIITWCIGTLFHKKTIASLDILNSDPGERRKMEEALAEQERNQ